MRDEVGVLQLFLTAEISPLISESLSSKSRATGNELPHGFNGAILKIVIEYDAGEYRFRHLLAGGMYYKYVAINEREVPIGEATSGFMKADYSLWKEKGEKLFSYINTPQDVVDLNEEGNFRNNVGGPVKPGDELSLRIGPGAIGFKEGKAIPLPLYTNVENNVGKSQP